jgi:hypothetical protein
MSKTLYTTATVLLLLFAIGHQLGFRKVDPSWHADQVVQAMQYTTMNVQGFRRTYWDFFSGFGFFVTAMMLFSALTAWTLGHASAGADLGVLRWSLAVCYVVIAALTWLNFFLIPGIFATAVALCLVAAAALA